MNTRLAIIRSEGKEHLCYREEECFVDVSYPMVTLNLPAFYRLDPHAFSAILNIQ